HVVEGPLDRGHDIADAAEVKHVVRVGEDRIIGAERAHVDLPDRETGVPAVVGEVVESPGGQVVDDPDLKATLEEQIDDVAPDEARPARDDGSLHVSLAAWTALTL